MASGGLAPVSAKDAKIDIQGLVEDWAFAYFRQKATSKKERKLQEQDNLGMEIDWKRVRFTHHPPEYTPKPPKLGEGTPTRNTLFSVSYTNKTDRTQKYHFQTERTTRSSCAVSVEQGYTKGIEMSVKLATPCEILEVNAGFKREMTLMNSESETIEEELSWSVDSEIEVEGKHTGEAKLIIIEEKYDGRFTIETEISGRVRIVYTNIKDNNSFIKTAESDIVKIAQEAISSKKIGAAAALSVDGTKKCIVCKTQGKCNFKYGVKQIVEVDQKPINKGDRE